MHLRQRVKIYCDEDSRIHILNSDGTPAKIYLSDRNVTKRALAACFPPAPDGGFFAVFPGREPLGPCAYCGGLVGWMNCWRKGVRVENRGNRRRPGHVREAFYCSMQCRDLGWRTAGEPLMQIDTPATKRHWLCRCQTGDDYVIDVGTGELVPHLVEYGTVLEMRRGGFIVSTHEIPYPDLPCGECGGTRVVSPAPVFFWSAPGEASWTPRWRRHHFDRDLTVEVYEAAPWEFQLQWFVAKDVAEYLPELVREVFTFPNPKALNQWWARLPYEALGDSEMERLAV